MVPFRTGELWGDGAGGAEALTTAYVATAAADAVFVDHECDICCLMTLPGVAPTSVEVQALVSVDGGTTWTVLGHDYADAAGTRLALAETVQRDGAVATHMWEWKIPHECLLRLQAKRTGGLAVDTTALIMGYARSAIERPAPAVSAGSVASSRYLAFADGTGAAEAVSNGAWTDSGETTLWFPSGVANSGTIDLSWTTVGVPTAFRARVLKRLSATTAAEFALAGTNYISAGVEDVDPHVIELPIATATAPGLTASFQCEPGYEYKLQLWRTGGTSIHALAYFNLTR